MQFSKALIALGIGTLTAVGLALPAAMASATGAAATTEPRPCDSQDHRTDTTCPPTEPSARPTHTRSHKPTPRPSKTSKSPTMKPTTMKPTTMKPTTMKPTTAKPTETSKSPTKPTETATTSAPAKLPTTGDATPLPLIAGVGAGLVIAGGVLVGMRRRRDATEQ
jgi:LPXTG-motif cell wall-anchored protein